MLIRWATKIDIPKWFELTQEFLEYAENKVTKIPDDNCC